MMKTVQVIAVLTCGATGCGSRGAQLGEIVSAAVGAGSGSAPAFSQTNLVGRMASTGNGLARTYHCYDARGRSVATEHVLDDASYFYYTSYGFPCASDACTGVAGANNGSVVISQTFPDLEVVRYTFDAGGGSQSITSTPRAGATQTVVSRILRNARGQTTDVDYGDSTSTTHHYNDASDLRLNQIETFLTAAPSTIVQLYTYAFDANGNLTGVNDYCNEASTGTCTTSAPNTVYSWSYQYDPRNQLVKGTRNGVAYAYAYDALGNLTNKEGITQTYFPSGAGLPRPHALSAVGSVTYSYNANGDVTGTSGTATNVSISWNADDMPERTSYGSITTNKSFRGEVLWKTQGATTTYYLPSMRVENGSYRKYYGAFAERDPDDNTSCTTNPSFGCLKFYHSDHLGSSALATNANGAVVFRQAYKPYGESLSSAGAFTPKYQFNFKEKEQDGTGFYDYGARMYDPATGRFLSADSYRADGLNRYAYVRNNPLGYTDPTGHWADPPKPVVIEHAADDPNYSVTVMGTADGQVLFDTDELRERRSLGLTLDVLIADGCDTASDHTENGIKAASGAAHFIGNDGMEHAIFTEIYNGFKISKAAKQGRYLDYENRTIGNYGPNQVYKAYWALRDGREQYRQMMADNPDVDQILSSK
jgi:RHS repeat-associated protein